MEGVLLGQPVIVCICEGDQVLLLSTRGEQNLQERRTVGVGGLQKAGCAGSGSRGQRIAELCSKSFLLSRVMGVRAKHAAAVS